MPAEMLEILDGPSIFLNLSFYSVTKFSTYRINNIHLRLSNFGIYWAKEKLHDNVSFTKKKIVFWMNFNLILVNKQIFHIWSSEIPHMILPKPMHPLRMIVKKVKANNCNC